MQSGKWIEDGILNQVTVKIGGKPIRLRKTHHQVEQFQKLAEARKSNDPTSGKTTGADLVAGNVQSALDICEIALNPDPGKVEFTREQISAELDADEIEILSRVYLDRKMFAPRIDRDPLFADQDGKPAPSAKPT